MTFGRRGARPSAPRGERVAAKAVKEQSPKVFAAMDALSKQFGAEVFRVAGQRYFKKQIERAKRQRQIVALKAEVAALEK